MNKKVTRGVSTPPTRLNPYPPFSFFRSTLPVSSSLGLTGSSFTGSAATFVAPGCAGVLESTSLLGVRPGLAEIIFFNNFCPIYKVLGNVDVESEDKVLSHFEYNFINYIVPCIFVKRRGGPKSLKKIHIYYNFCFKGRKRGSVFLLKRMKLVTPYLNLLGLERL